MDALRRITDLFVADADRFNNQQIALLGDVLDYLTDRIETKAMIALSTHLAPVGNAPVELMRRLTRDNEIAVAGPVLAQSARLTTDDLAEIAATKTSFFGNFEAPRA